MKKIITAVLFGICLNTFAQAPVIEWQKSLGGSNYDRASCIRQTADGGYIVTGKTNSNDGDVTGIHDYFDGWIVKLSGSHIIEWQKYIGGNGEDEVISIKQTTDEGYIVAVKSTSTNVIGNHGASDFWIMKITSTGSEEWQKSLGGSGDDIISAIWQTTDDGYVAVGYSLSNDGDVTGNHGTYDYWVVKLTSAGIIEWQRSLGGTDMDFAMDLEQTSDGGYIVVGYTISINGDIMGNHGGVDCWIVKLTSTGTLDWQKCLGGGNYDYAMDIQQTEEGGYIVTGNSGSDDGDITNNHGSGDYWVVKLTSLGVIDWQKCLGGIGVEEATSIQQTTDGGYIIAGHASYNDADVTGNLGINDFWIVKLDTVGAVGWKKCFGGTGDEWASSVQQTIDGGYVIAGYSASNDVDVSGNHGHDDFWVVKLASDTNGADVNTIPPSLVSIYPNPSTEMFTVDFGREISKVHIRLKNLEGQTIFNQIVTNQYQFSFSIDQPVGVYLLCVESEDETTIQRLVKVSGN